MGRSPCCDKVGLKKGPWTPEEDQKLLAYIDEHGHGSWCALPSKAGLQRCGKSCRLRWTNYLRPDIKRGKFTLQEEQTIIQLHALLGNRWSAIATHLAKRTDNEIKNYWNTHLKKRLAKMGIDPVTHKPKNDTILSGVDGQSKSSANLSHLAQWESARLEAEARLVRESKLRSRPFQSQPLTNKPWTGLESPTSTLTMNSHVHAMLELVGTSGSPDKNPTRLAGLIKEGNMDNSMSFYSTHLVDPWTAESRDHVEEGFTNLLLNDSDHDHRSLSDSGSDIGGGSRSECEDNKDYWNSILNLVNSSPSESPMF